MNLTYSALISNESANHTRKTIANEETLTYYIDTSIGWNSLERYYQGILVDSAEITTNNLGHNSSKRIFIRDLLTRLDTIIDLDFLEMSHNNGSMLDIYHVNYSSSFKENVIGQAIPQHSSNGYWWDILWKEASSTLEINNDTDLNTIIHEIGHSLGLSHPFNDPTNESFSSKDTIMSYNRGAEGWDYWFSETDLNALISIWGRENDNGTINFDESSKNYKFHQKASNTYYIKTTIGLEDITNINKLKFTDKSYNVQEDIIGVFNLIKGKEDISGKIYRLYNAGFGRFPDREGFNYWIENNTTNIDTYRETATSFLLSNEFVNLYGKHSSNSQYITNLYSNILNRSPDTNGFNYWLNQLSNAYEDRSEILMGFSESSENQTIFSNETSIF